MPDRAESYRQAVSVLPEPVLSRARALSREDMSRAEELRLRAGRVPAVVFPEGERPLDGLGPAGAALLERVLEAASRWSLHTVLDQVCQGFITLEGGHRLGLCGRAVMEDGRIRSLRDISSLSLRVARQVPGAAAQAVPLLWEGGALQSTLILAPPGAGKTTLLRDLIRAVSCGEGGPPLRVGVADERGELAASWRGVPQMDLGPRTDVLEGCPKAQGMLLLLRGMNPQVLAADEITAREDLPAIQQAAGCGAVLLATAHAGGAEDLRRRPLYRSLMGLGVFRRVVTIHPADGRREVEVADTEALGW